MRIRPVDALGQRASTHGVRGRVVLPFPSEAPSVLVERTPAIAAPSV